MNKQQMEMQSRRAKIKKHVTEYCIKEGAIPIDHLLAWIQLNFSVSDRKAKEDVNLFIKSETFIQKGDLLSIEGFWPEDVAKIKMEENEKLKY